MREANKELKKKGKFGEHTEGKFEMLTSTRKEDVVYKIYSKRQLGREGVINPRRRSSKGDPTKRGAERESGRLWWSLNKSLAPSTGDEVFCRENFIGS